MPKGTVIIGLGGGGKVILMKMRRLIVEEYGSLSALPHVQFLHVDTFDSQSAEPTQMFKSTVLGEDLIFKQGKERLDLSKAIKDKKKTNIVSDKNVKEWYPDDLPVVCDFVEGAGGVRPFGKLAFHHSVNVFENTLNKAVQLASTSGGGGVDVFVVCSLFGGTGSGTYLDVCYSVRKVLGEIGVAQKIIGWFVVGALETSPILRRSCYAALRELEYFTTMGLMNTLKAQSKEGLAQGLSVHKPFEARYPIVGVTDITSQSPPVDVCYLFSATNAEQVVFERDRLENTIAKRIFFELMDGIGKPLQAQRVNMVGQTTYSTGDEVQGRAKTFFSTGISVIEFPAPQIQHALASGLAAYCCHYALFDKALGRSDLKGEVDVFMKELGLKERQIREQFEKLNNGTLTTAIGDDIKVWERRLKSKVNMEPFDKASLDEEINQVIREADGRVREGEQTPYQLGTYAQTILNNTERVWQKIRPTITVRIGKMVGDNSIGPKRCGEFLYQVRGRLKSDKETYSKMMGSRDTDMRAADSKVNWRKGRFKDDLYSKYRWELRKHSQWLCKKELDQFLEMGKEKAFYKRADDLIHRVDQELKQLQENVAIYVDKLEKWGQEFVKNMLEIFQNLRDQQENDPVNRALKEILEDILKDVPRDDAKWDKIIGKFYEKLVLRLFKEYKIPNTIGNIDTVTEEIVKKVSGGRMGKSLFNAVLENEDSFKTEVLKLCRNKLGGVRKVSICDLITGLETGERKRFLEEKEKDSAWLLQVDTTDRTIDHVPGQCEKKWVGVWDQLDQKHDIWKDSPNYNKTPSLKEPYRMVFVSEMGVFPLRSIDVIESYRNAYEGMDGDKKQKTFKTIDFPDIFPPNPALKDIHMRARRANVLGKTFGFLKKGEDPQDHYTKVYLYYSDEVAKSQKNRLLCTEWEEVIETFRNVQEEKDIARRRSDVTPLELLEKEIHREGTSAKTREDREALRQKTLGYLKERLDELEQKEEHPFYQSDLAIIEAFQKEFNLHPAQR